jgi:L-alanine-DL-glutamate epimerase-like enolase superfamily enzyme
LLRVPVKLALRQAHFFFTDIATRLPFRFGAVTVTGFPLLHLAVTLEDERGRRAEGYAADNLVPKWFDKDPGKSAERNFADLLASAEIAAALWADVSRHPRSLFDLWEEAYPECQRQARGRALNGLTGAFGSALVERALADALGRLEGASLQAMLVGDALGIRPQRIHPEASEAHLHAWASRVPATSITLRHTVGMLDPLVDAPGLVADGEPASLEGYVRRQGLTHFKLKLGGDVATDLERLAAIAAVIDRLVPDYRVTLDGNEQYKSLAPLAELVARLAEDRRLQRLAAALLFIEQPLDRAVALDGEAAAGLAELGRRVPIIIDESDDDPRSFAQALGLGYRGVSTKNCKGVIKSFLNRTLVEARRSPGVASPFMSAEDLTNLPVVPLQQDLVTVLALGISHVERNGHHYIRGLAHCSPRDRALALAHHGDLYEARGEEVFLRIRDGRLATASLAGPGYGVAFAPDLAAMTPLEAWPH